MGIEYDGVYVVGSYCFNVYDPGDVDILIVAPNVGITEAGAAAGREIIERGDFKVKPNLNDQTCDLGFKVPYYDVVEGRLHHKDPYATIPFSFQLREDFSTYVTTLRDKVTRVSSLIGLTA